MKVLLVGSGAREHALARALRRDPMVDDIVAVPGNPGIAELATCIDAPPAGLTDGPGLVAIARAHAIDLAVIGPEGPLVAGVADALREAGFATFGPSGRAAQLEGSKAFAKWVMAEAGVPTALAHVCTTEAEVIDALDGLGVPHVVKDDGLAAGKGVVVTNDRGAALEHALACLAGSSGRVVIEEYLDGPEVSLFCLCDGETVVPLAPAQDFKRVADGDEGPNTGGMGAYSPLNWAPTALAADVVARIAEPTLAQMTHLGMPFVGVLYVGLALTSSGTKVVEFNVRFGDPETQVVLARLRTPLGALLHAAAVGQLGGAPPLRWGPDVAVTVVLAAPGYPDDPHLGGELTGLTAPDDPEAAYLLHAGTTRTPDGSLLAAGGRVLSVVGTAPTLAAARAKAYAAIAQVSLPGSHYRSDIAQAAELGEVHLPGSGSGR